MTYQKRIAYGKLGRALALDAGKFGFAGDAEAPQLLKRLAERNPDVEWVIVGRNDGTDPQSVGLPPNVVNTWTAAQQEWRSLKPERDGNGLSWEGRKQVNDWYRERLVPSYGHLDGVVVHVGQHGSVHTFVPPTTKKWATGELVTPQDWAFLYGGPFIVMLNALGDQTDGRCPITWLVTDPRNYLKAHDVKWPTNLDDVLAQYDYMRASKHDRWQDARTPEELGFKAKLERDGEIWRVNGHYRYADLEFMMLPDDWETWGEGGFDDRPYRVGVGSTGAWDNQDHLRRSWLIRKYVLDNFPDAWLNGKFDKKSLDDIGDWPMTAYGPDVFHQVLGQWKTTIALPAASKSKDGYNWTTAKPLQCFAARVACFFVGPLDAQGWLLPSTRNVHGAHEVAPGLYSIRDDWSEDELNLARWLRVSSPDEYRARMEAVSSSRETWEWIVTTQRNLVKRRWDAKYLEQTIEWQQRIGAFA